LRAAALLALCLLSHQGATAQGQLLFLDAYKHLSGSTPDGKSGQELTPFALGDKEGLQMLAAGRKYALFRHTSKDRDTVFIHDTATHQLEYTQEVPVNTDIAGPLFGDPDTFMLRTFVGATDKNSAFIVKLRAGKLLGTISTQGFKDSIRALPDGRLYRINDDSGRIAVAAADGGWRDIGALQIPPRLKISDWRISHRGDKLAIMYGSVDSGGVYRSDIWVANIDGSGQYRLTSQWDMMYPRWSPDDRYVAFQFDTTSSLINPAGLGGAGLYGHCSYWYAPVEASNVSGISYGKAHPIARQMYVKKSGREMADTCTLLAWEH
jgi:hypothetical protein